MKKYHFLSIMDITTEQLPIEQPPLMTQQVPDKSISIPNIPQTVEIDEPHRKIKDSSPVSAICFTPDGGKLIGIRGNQITIWDARSGKKIRTFISTKYLVSVAYDVKRKRIAVGDVDGRITIYNESGKWIRELPI